MPTKITTLIFVFQRPVASEEGASEMSLPWRKSDRPLLVYDDTGEYLSYRKNEKAWFANTRVPVAVDIPTGPGASDIVKRLFLRIISRILSEREYPHSDEWEFVYCVGIFISADPRKHGETERNLLPRTAISVFTPLVEKPPSRKHPRITPRKRERGKLIFEGTRKSHKKTAKPKRRRGKVTY